jgi:tetratricopeptide (TPR) repeat protein
LAHQGAGHLDKASGQFRLAIDMHLQLDKNQRNDIHLLSIRSNLAINYFVAGKFEEAISNQRSALSLAEALNIYNTSLFRQTLDTLYSFYVNLERFSEAEALKKKYEHQYF